MRDVTILLPVMNEAISLRQTVEILLHENEDILEIIIVVSHKTLDKSMEVIEELKKRHPDIIKVHLQNLPSLGGALREGFELSNGKYTVMMSSDLETDPHDVSIMIREIKSGDVDIVTASRWIVKDSFNNYGTVKYYLNHLFQKVFSFIYLVSLTDMTYGFRIFKTELIKKIKWEELRHPFLFETIIKPIRLGCKVKEIPSKWISRKEGRSQNKILNYFGYLKIGLTVRFAKKKSFLKGQTQEH